jgi:hypothetical protein
MRDSIDAHDRLLLDDLIVAVGAADGVADIAAYWIKTGNGLLSRRE